MTIPRYSPRAYLTLPPADRETLIAQVMPRWRQGKDTLDIARELSELESAVAIALRIGRELVR